MSFISVMRRLDISPRGQDDSLSIFLADSAHVECPHSVGVVKDFCATVSWASLDTLWSSQKVLLDPQYPNTWHQDQIIDMTGVARRVNSKCHNGITPSQLLKYFETPVS